MERTISVEEKIKRAEEIYNRRKGYQTRNTTARVNLDKKRNSSVIKKMRNQIIACTLIYLIFYFLINNNFIFSEELKNKINEVLSYEVNFNDIYIKVSDYFNNLRNELIQGNNEEKKEETIPVNNEEGKEIQENNNSENDNQEKNSQENNNVDDNSVENNETSSVNENLMRTSDINNGETIENSIGGANEENINDEKEITEEEQMKKDAEEIKNNIKFIVPVQGTITSKYGERNPTVSTVSKFHTGLDIGTETGTDIISATDGKVILRSTTGDYGNHLKIENSDILIIYAHCSKLLVNEGEEVKQGQKIAEVGSTGNSTGPHLHFEIRKSGRYVNPQWILDI
ncbi:MAG: peptidoglycan DD-metalloendopeptidase family protein [Clostridia bacterium]|nr:peptidoglycan DD-metalloendopeptidase family protein [Clostridia bacterium]